MTGDMMTETIQCIERGLEGSSPFSRLIAIDIYDGPMSGLIQAMSSEWYVFRLLAWDERQAMRAFSLAPLHGTVATRITAALTSLEEPVWPEWWLHGGGSASTMASMRQLFAEARREAGEECAVVISRALLATVDATRQLATPEQQQEFKALSRRVPDDSEVTETPFKDWKTFVDLGSSGS